MSPRTDEQNRQIRDGRREQILQAALRVFAQKGLSAAKISDIAEAAGLSHGLVYHYFKSKDEIFTTLVDQAFQASIQIVSASARVEGSPLERIRSMTEALIPAAYQADGPYYFLIMIQAFTSDAVPEEVKAMTATQGDLYAESLVPVIEEGQRTGEIAPGDPQVLSRTYFALIQGLAISQIQAEDERMLPTPEMVMRFFTRSGHAEETTRPHAETGEVTPRASVKGGFGPIPLREGSLTYRMRSGPNANWTTLQASVERTTMNGEASYRLTEDDESAGRTVSLVRVEDWKPIRIEAFSPQGDSTQSMVYQDGTAVLKKPGSKTEKILKTTLRSFDMNTLNFVFRAFPFGREEQVDFDLVMDGRNGIPIGVFPMTIRAKGRDQVETPAGMFDCYRLELGVGGAMAIFAAKYKYDFWYTVSEPRLLVKYEDREGNLIELMEGVGEADNDEKTI